VLYDFMPIVSVNNCYDVQTTGSALPCFVTKNVEGIDESKSESELAQAIEVIKNCAGVAYLGECLIIDVRL
jgi:hypothetical protein